MSDPNVRFDLRTVKRYLDSGRLEKAEYEAFLSKLDDAAENITEPEEGGDDDGFEDRMTPASERSKEAAPAPAAAAPAPAPSAVAPPLVPPVAPPAIGDAPAPPPPPLEVPIGKGPNFGPPKVD